MLRCCGAGNEEEEEEGDDVEKEEGEDEEEETRRGDGGGGGGGGRGGQEEEEAVAAAETRRMHTASWCLRLQGSSGRAYRCLGMMCHVCSHVGPHRNFLGPDRALLGHVGALA